MDFSLVHAGLAGGALLAAFPLILHLFMRQKPKRVIFPALRLIRDRQKRTKKRLAVKNWLLLLARMLLLALMALALARPRLTTETSLSDDQVPSAIALIFDTSLSMGYKERDKTRLDEAKAKALEILMKTPSTSQIYIVDSAEAGSPTPLSPSSAQKKVEELRLRNISRPLNASVGQAYSAVMGSDLELHEVYVFTDLARSAWDMDRPVEALEKVKAFKKGIKTFVVRLTPREVTNVSIVEAEPVGGRATENEPVEIAVKLRSLGPPTQRTVEVRVDGVPRLKQTVDLKQNGEADLKLVVPTVDPKLTIHQGEVRLTGSGDPLEFDDRRFFSFTVKPAIRVLVISDLAIDSEFIGDAIDPASSTAGPFRADRIRPSQFEQKSENLSTTYRCIFINNVGSLDESAWAKLSNFVRDGGGLVIALGQRSRIVEAGSTQEQVYPAALEKTVSPKTGTAFGQIKDVTNRLFSKYRKELEAMLAIVPVAKYWEIKPKKESRVLLAYSDGSPALVESLFSEASRGRVLLWTTPLSRRPEVGSSEAWNEFPNEILGWSFYYLMNQTVAYLTDEMGENLNIEAGNDLLLPIDPTKMMTSFLVVSPDRKSTEPLKPAVASNTLVVVAPQEIGQWSVKGSSTAGGSETFGFSVNARPSESQFFPLEADDLTKLFGDKDRYALADDAESLERIQTLVRVGRELFPWIMILIIMIVTMESVLSNRFYRESQSSQPPRIVSTDLNQ